MTGHVEIERKVEPGPGFSLPDLTAVEGVAGTGEAVQHTLSATYFDTADLRLARAGLTLRRRTGGTDAGWHLKLPASGAAREERHHPLGPRRAVPPKAVLEPVLGIVRTAPVAAVATLDTTRVVTTVLADDGRVLAEVADDTVTGTAHAAGPDAAATVTSWREVEVELVDGDEALLDALVGALVAAGAAPSDSPSKLSRVLEARLAPESAGAEPAKSTEATGTKAEKGSGEEEEGRAAAGADRRGRRPGRRSVPRCRRCRPPTSWCGPATPTASTTSASPAGGCAASWRRSGRCSSAPAPIRCARSCAGWGRRCPRPGTARSRSPTCASSWPPSRWSRCAARSWPACRRRPCRTPRPGGARRCGRWPTAGTSPSSTPSTPCSTEPPLAGAAATRPVRCSRARSGAPASGWPSASRSRARPARRRRSEDSPLHDVRKAAKRVRYTAEVAVPVLGEPAEALVTGMEEVQEDLGAAQDTVATRDWCLRLGRAAGAAGEPTWTWGRLYALEEARAAACAASFWQRQPGLRRMVRAAAR